MRFVARFDETSQMTLAFGIEQGDLADLVHVQAHRVLIGPIDTHRSIRASASTSPRRLHTRFEQGPPEFAALVEIERLLDGDSVILDCASHRVDQLGAEFDVVENVNDLFSEQTATASTVIDQFTPIGQRDSACGRRKYSAHAVARAAHRHPPGGTLVSSSDPRATVAIPQRPPERCVRSRSPRVSAGRRDQRGSRRGR